MHHVPGTRRDLLQLVTNFCTGADIAVYIRDKSYGPDGCYDDFRLLTPIKLQHAGSSKQTKGNTREGNWCRDYPLSLLFPGVDYI